MNLNGQRILMVKQSSLGDIIHTLPVVHALKRCFPACRIGWVVEQGLSPLVARDPAVTEVHPIHIPSTSDPEAGRWAYGRAFTATLRELLGLRRAFRARPYDLILDLHASFRSGLLALMNAGGVRVGFADAREFNTLFQHQRVPVPVGVVHAVDKNLLFSAHFGCAVLPEDFFMATDEDDEQQVRDFLAAAGIGEQQRIAYVNPTARWQAKFWLQPRWSELCDRLLTAGVYPVFGGSRGDLPYLEAIAQSMAGGAVIAAGRLSLTQSVALMKRASVYVGLDTGPMHIAAMVGTPVVALFGPTHPERVGPYRVDSAVLQAQGLDCLCCRKRVCAQPRCMEGISVDQVFAQVMRFAARSESDGKTACSPA